MFFPAGVIFADKHVGCAGLGLGFILLILLGLAPSVPGFSIGVYSVLTGLGGYAIVYGFLASLKLPRERYIHSKEFGFSLVALFVFMGSLPFFEPGDFTFIPQGFLDDKFIFFLFIPCR